MREVVESIEGNAEFIEKEKQVVETTCGSHEKTSKDNL